MGRSGIFHLTAIEPMSRVGWAYRDYVARRDRRGRLDLGAVRCPSERGLVSVILPVHNGERYLAEAIQSVLAQTHANLELIAVDDGSTDSTPEILARFVNLDRRVRVISQPNKKLPAALNAGLAAARGEFLTWTSDDNRMKPGLIEYMVKALRADPAVGLVYADYEMIDAAGAPNRNTTYWERFQNPPGSGRICLPDDISILDYCNYIGPAFLYTDRARLLVGDYNSRHFTCEDYDFFLRVKQWLTLRHTPGRESLYEYREHGASLTSRRGEFKITDRVEKLLRTDEFRRDMTFYPVCWLSRPDDPIGRELLKNGAGRGDTCLDPATLRAERLPRAWLPSVFIHSTDRVGDAATPPVLPANCFKVLIDTGTQPLSETIAGDWDLCVTLQNPATLPRLEGGRRGWIAIQDIESLAEAVRIRTLSDYAPRIEDFIEQSEAAPESFAASVIICTHGRVNSLERTLESLCNQTVAAGRFEIIVVNTNDETDLEPQIDSFRGRLPNLRLADCPLRGQSPARNAGFAEARGEFVVYLDDHSSAYPDFLERMLEAASDPSVGVVGGAIMIEPMTGSYSPAARTTITSDDWRRFPLGSIWGARRRALLEIGGFRRQFGRAEDVVAALQIRRLGLNVVIEPAARARFMTDRPRPGLWDLYQSTLTVYETQLRLEQALLLENYTGAGGTMLGCFKHLAHVFSPRTSRAARIFHLFSAIGCGWLAMAIVKMYFGRMLHSRLGGHAK